MSCSGSSTGFGEGLRLARAEDLLDSLAYDLADSIGDAADEAARRVNWPARCRHREMRLSTPLREVTEAVVLVASDYPRSVPTLTKTTEYLQRFFALGMSWCRGDANVDAQTRFGSPSGRFPE